MLSPDHRLFGFDRNGPVQIQTENGLMDPHGDFAAVNADLCRKIGRKLSDAYPGHPWGVMAEAEHGIVKIALQGFIQWPVTIKLSTLASDPGLRSVVRYAGEILERLRLPRTGFSMADWRAANSARPWVFNRNKRPPE
jgi:hypothetical protein